MKNKTVFIVGFIIGAAGFLLLFKYFVLPSIPPSDEIAPGLVMLAALTSGLTLGVAVFMLHRYYKKKKN